jgi:hypothetical protein
LAKKNEAIIEAARAGASAWQLSAKFSISVEQAKMAIDSCAESTTKSHALNLQNILLEQVPRSIRTLQELIAATDTPAYIRLKAADTLLRYSKSIIDKPSPKKSEPNFEKTLFDF